MLSYLLFFNCYLFLFMFFVDDEVEEVEEVGVVYMLDLFVFSRYVFIVMVGDYD